METATVEKKEGLDRRVLGGWGLIAGDAAMFAHGLLSYVDPQIVDIAGESSAARDTRIQSERSAGKGLMGTAVGWSIGGVALAKYGKRKVEDQLERVEEKLAAFMKEKGIPLDAEKIAKADRQQQRGWFKQFEDFMYDYPTEIMNAY